MLLLLLMAISWYRGPYRTAAAWQAYPIHHRIRHALQLDSVFPSQAADFIRDMDALLDDLKAKSGVDLTRSSGVYDAGKGSACLTVEQKQWVDSLALAIRENVGLHPVSACGLQWCVQCPVFNSCCVRYTISAGTITREQEQIITDTVSFVADAATAVRTAGGHVHQQVLPDHQPRAAHESTHDGVADYAPLITMEANNGHTASGAGAAAELRAPLLSELDSDLV